MNILETIKMKKDTLTKKQRMVASYMSMHLDAMGYITLKDLSREIGVTEITILNTCLSLGYEGFNDVKYEFRKVVITTQKTDVLDEKSSYSEKVPRYELSNKEMLLNEIGNEELKMLTDYWQRNNMKKIFQAVALILKSSHIIICGRGVSFTLAEFLKNYLGFCEIFSIAINTELSDSTYGIFSTIDENTLVIPISFPDYYFMTLKVAEYAKEKKATILAITNREDAELAAYADVTLAAPTSTRVFLNTLSAPMMMINLLVSALKLSQVEKDGDGL